MGLGLLVSIPGLIGAWVFAKFIGKKVKASDEADNGETVQTYEELVASYGKLPSGFMSLAPIIIPIILMAMSNVSSILGWTGALNATFVFLGTPIIALAVGVILGIILLIQSDMGDKLYDLTNDTLKTVGPILFVTAAGGVLGKVISSTSLVAFITEQADILQSIGIFFPFLLAAILKTAQGSSTVAITTTAGIMAPLMAPLGMDSTIMSVLCVMAIGAGAMTVSHANDSYFWVVTNFGSMTPDQGYKTQTLATLVQGLCAIIFIFILTLIFH
jgi:GntP family gluconate:H+ symporter